MSGGVVVGATGGGAVLSVSGQNDICAVSLVTAASRTKCEDGIMWVSPQYMSGRSLVAVGAGVAAL